MSDVPFDPSQAGGQGQPSEEEVRAYLGQLRAAPVEQVVAEVASALLNAAQVKLGRHDGRLLIDLSAALVDAGRSRLPQELTSQVDEALTQLRLAQVEAEKEVVAAAGQGHHEEGDIAAEDEPAAGGGDPAAAQQPRSTPPPSSAGGAASRLWVPGR